MYDEKHEAARAWGYTYDIYRWQYLVSGPRGFGQRAPVVRADLPVPSGIPSNSYSREPLLGNTEPDALKSDPIPNPDDGAASGRRPSALPPSVDALRDSQRTIKRSRELGWMEELEYALCSLAALHAKARPNFKPGSQLEEFLGYCAWQVVDNTRAHGKLVVGAAAEALGYLEAISSNPYGRNSSDLTLLGDAHISDERSELQILSGEYPRYTYQVTVDRPFSEVREVIGDPKQWTKEACRRLLSLGPWVDPDSSYDQKENQGTLRFDFPERTSAAENDWKGVPATACYATDLSENDSTIRLDFSLRGALQKSVSVPAEPEDEPLLVEDSGYYLVRKSLAKVGRSDLIVQRSLWFSPRAFGLNAALRPLFKMIVDHRVLREFAELCKKPEKRDLNLSVVPPLPPPPPPPANSNRPAEPAPYDKGDHKDGDTLRPDATGTHGPRAS